MENKIVAFLLTVASTLLTTILVIAGFGYGWERTATTLDFYRGGVIIGVVCTVYWLFTAYLWLSKD